LVARHRRLHRQRATGNPEDRGVQDLEAGRMMGRIVLDAAAV
jgi:hypothetical protein